MRLTPLHLALGVTGSQQLSFELIQQACTKKVPGAPSGQRHHLDRQTATPHPPRLTNREWLRGGTPTPRPAPQLPTPGRLQDCGQHASPTGEVAGHLRWAIPCPIDGVGRCSDHRAARPVSVA